MRNLSILNFRDFIILAVQFLVAHLSLGATIMNNRDIQFQFAWFILEK